jgi:O-methyltransferase
LTVHSEVSEENLRKLVELAETAPPGDFVEIGVYKGGSAVRLYEIAQRQSRTLHLFDTFEGMPVYTNGLDTFRIGTFLVDADMPERLQRLMPKAKLYIGCYPETHPAVLSNVAFIHCDCDQYISYRAVIEHMWPLVVPGGMMLFDDYPYLRGAKRAVEESFAQHELLPNGEHFYVKKP